MNTLQEQLKIIQAAIDGKSIEFRAIHSGIDWETSHNPAGFNFPAYVYRIKPEPRVIYVNEYSDNNLNGLRVHVDKDNAIMNSRDGCIRTIKFIEVLE